MTDAEERNFAGSITVAVTIQCYLRDALNKINSEIVEGYLRDSKWNHAIILDARVVEILKAMRKTEEDLERILKEMRREFIGPTFEQDDD